MKPTSIFADLHMMCNSIIPFRVLPQKPSKSKYFSRDELNWSQNKILNGSGVNSVLHIRWVSSYFSFFSLLFFGFCIFSHSRGEVSTPHSATRSLWAGKHGQVCSTWKKPPDVPSDNKTCTAAKPSLPWKKMIHEPEDTFKPAWWTYCKTDRGVILLKN